MKFNGISIDKRDIFVCCNPILKKNSSILQVYSYDGKNKFTKEFNNRTIYNVKKINDKTEILYSYLLSNNKRLPRIITGNFPGYLEIVDHNFNVVKTNIKLLPTGSIKEPTGCDCHCYYIYDKDHYILAGHIPVKVNNIAELNGKSIWIANCILQEQKNGEVVWQFETADYPELYSLSIYRNDYVSSEYDNFACDYAHLNSFQVTSDNKYVYLCYRNIGVIKIEKETKTIVGRYCNKLNNELFIGQHDLRLIDDNTFTVYNNNEVTKYKTNKKTNAQCCIVTTNNKHEIQTYEYYNTPEYAGACIGGAILLDRQTNTWNITYSPFSTFKQVKEYSFNLNKINYELLWDTILPKYTIYNIEREKYV